MSKKKTETPLTVVEKDYIKLYLADLQKNKGKVTPEDFQWLAERVSKSVETVTRFANQQPEVEIEKETPQSEKPKLTPIQEMVRNNMKGKTASGRDSVSFMSEANSQLIQDIGKSGPKKSSRFDRNIYRGNK